MAQHGGFALANMAAVAVLAGCGGITRNGFDESRASSGTGAATSQGWNLESGAQGASGASPAGGGGSGGTGGRAASGGAPSAGAHPRG
ncbi:MAG: hypothetical protein JW940_04380 [Polyangiaceae bacterium]|nr:hypothetical protein [Polyangiaceae bacterium]